MGLFDNVDYDSLLGLGGMLLSAGAPSTQSVGSRLGAGFQQYAQQQKEAPMRALQMEALKGQVAGQDVQRQAALAKMAQEKEQQELLQRMLGQGSSGIAGQMGPRPGSDSATSMPPGGMPKLTLEQVARAKIAGMDLMPLYKAQNPEMKTYDPIVLSDPKAPGKSVTLDKASDQAKIKELVAGGWTETASPGSSSRNVQFEGTYVNPKTGQALGQYYFDKGLKQLINIDTNEPLPPGSVPRVDSQVEMGRIPVKDFHKLGDELYQDEVSLNALKRYAGTVKDSGQGLTLLANKVSGAAKTIFGTSPLSKAELATMEGNGELQGLLGKWREEVVGGGVMTEFDAVRVLERLGGDVNALRNPQVVSRLLGSIYKEKLGSYKRRAHRYENQRDKYYPDALPATKFTDEDYTTIESVFGDRPTQGPKAGITEDGYRFKGGDPGDPANWEKVK